MRDFGLLNEKCLNDYVRTSVESFIMPILVIADGTGLVIRS